MHISQRDPIIAKQLFGSLFSAIIKEMDKYKTTSEKNNITQKLLQDFNHFLTTTYSFFPPFVACIQVKVYTHFIGYILYFAWLCLKTSFAGGRMGDICKNVNNKKFKLEKQTSFVSQVQTQDI